MVSYFGLQVLVASSQASLGLQSAGPVGAGVYCANADRLNTVMKPLSTAAETSLRMMEPPELRWPTNAWVCMQVPTHSLALLCCAAKSADF